MATTAVALRLGKKRVQEVELRARLEGRSVSEWLREAIEDRLRLAPKMGEGRAKSRGRGRPSLKVQPAAAAAKLDVPGQNMIWSEGFLSRRDRDRGTKSGINPPDRNR